jgi:hypothetical protein
MVQASIASDYNCNSAIWLTACGKKQSTARTVQDRRSALNDTIVLEYLLRPESPSRWAIPQNCLSQMPEI